jgi:hypothetical protein
MSQPLSPVGTGRARRQARREEKDRQEALLWLRKPGVLIFLGVLILAAAGWGLLFRAVHRLPVKEATIDGLSVQAESRWIVDQMEHGTNFQQPASMMPDLPTFGSQRVLLDLAIHNRSDRTQVYRGEEFTLVPEIGDKVEPFGGVVGDTALEPGQTINATVHFDLDTTRPHGKLIAEWRHGRRTAYFSVPDPPEHYHLQPRENDLPPDARLLLPLGEASRGERLYAGTYGCSACHGDPKVADSNNIGPHLAHIAGTAGTRIAGVPAAQYLYQSMLDPDAFIAPQCKGGAPCQQPSAMPDYSKLLTVQDAADLLAYLLAQGS